MEPVITKEKINEILKNNGINEHISDVIIKDCNTLKGNKIHHVTVKFQNETTPSLKFFMKTKPDKFPDPRMVESVVMMFTKETRFFMDYVPAAQEFCKSFGQEDLLKIYPKCYYGDETTILFENLLDVDRGYFMMNKGEQQDFESAKLALTSLAKHHAISYAFIKSLGGPEVFFQKFPKLDFEPFCQAIPVEILGYIMEIGIVRDCSILEKSNLDKKGDAIAALQSFTGNAWNDFIGCTSIIPEDKLLILYHGDYCGSTSLFKKDENSGIVVDHVISDMHMSSYGSPCLDISYYMFTSVKPEVRRERLHDMLKIYLDTLTITTEKLGSPIQLTFEEFFLNFRAKVKFGFWISVVHEADILLPATAKIKPELIKDRKEFLKGRNEYIQKWLDDHPQELEKVARNIFEHIDEFNQLRL